MNLSSASPLIALDADGVLLNYHEAYQKAWLKAFGEDLPVVNSEAYYAMDRFGARRLEAKEREHLRGAMDDQFWSSMNPLPGALEATRVLKDKGYRLAVVSAVSVRYLEARAYNFARWGFPLEAVYATGSEVVAGASPKAAVIQQLRPVAFVDDYAPYFTGIHPETGIQRILIDRTPVGGPNRGAVLSWVDASYPDILACAQALPAAA